MASLQVCRAAGLLLFVCAEVITASSFLSRAQEGNVKDLTPELEASILQEMEEVLGNSSHGLTDVRLGRIEDMLRITFKSLPKTEQGKLQHAAVRYTLHSYFVQRHAWHIRGLASLAEENGALSSTSLLQDKVEDFVQGAFERRMGSHGLDLKDIAVLAATYENLVHKEMTERLEATLRVMNMAGWGSMTLGWMDDVIDTYMIGYILNLNYTLLEPHQLTTIKESITKIYPTWPDTQNFLREVRAGSSLHRSYFSRSDVEVILKEVFDQYGRWQDRECRSLKEQMVAIEDKSIGVNGSGRVRLTDFYGSALRDGNWQFSESADWLTQNGALDTHGVQRVIIANYMNSPSNCLASSKFYSVCCINECEDLMDHIEHHFAAPSATPAAIAEFISGLPSSSVSAGRTLPQILEQRLGEIADRNEGQVPLHGRLFSQWMHHAYPRECPYPHLSGTTRPQSVSEYASQNRQAPVATKAEMTELVEGAMPHVGDALSDEVTQWSQNEELYVGDHKAAKKGSASAARRGGLWQVSRPLVYASVALATAGMLAQRCSSLFGTKQAGIGTKQAAKWAGGKDLYV